MFSSREKGCFQNQGFWGNVPKSSLKISNQCLRLVPKTRGGTTQHSQINHHLDINSGFHSESCLLQDTHQILTHITSPTLNETGVAKINLLICSSTGYKNIPHLSMKQKIAIHPPYTINSVNQVE